MLCYISLMLSAILFWPSVSLCVCEASVAIVFRCKKHILFLKAGCLKEGSLIMYAPILDATLGDDVSGFWSGLWCIMMLFFVIVVKKDSSGCITVMAVAYRCGALCGVEQELGY